MTHAQPSPLRLVIGAVVVTAGVALVWTLFTVGRAVRTGVDRAVDSLAAPGVPEPGPAETSKVALTDAGVSITVKQRAHAWLPGGEFRLHLDDITGGQVLISVTDRSDQVVFGPASVKAGDSIRLDMTQPAIRLEVGQLVNLLTGDDFGEFAVLPGETKSR